MTRTDRIGKEGDDLLNDIQERRFAQLNAIERLLARRLLKDLAAMLDENNGRITTRKGFITIAKAVDQIFDAVEGKQLVQLGDAVVGDMAAVLNFNANYYRVLAVNKGGRFDELKANVDATMRKRLGIGAKGNIMEEGYLSGLFSTQQARDEVKNTVQKAISGGIPMKRLKEALVLKVAGTPGPQGAMGTLEKTVGAFLYNAYSVADAATNNEFGARLGLKYFVYAGGLIETSRDFCRKKNNKVFTTEEANRDWPNDPTLPKTAAERKDGGPPPDYVPLEERGRWQCRHRLLYIPEQEAFRLRPDLKGK